MAGGLVDVFVFELGVDDGLAGVQPIVAGEHVADAADQGKIQQPTIPEQLHGQEDGGQRAVGGPAEHRGHAKRPTKAVGKAQQRPHRGSKRRPSKQHRHDLPAPKARAQSCLLYTSDAADE